MNYGLAGSAPQAQPGMDAPVPRLTEVQEQVKRSAAMMQGIEEKVSVLRDRLQPVLRGTSSKGTSSDKVAPKPTLVGHANALSNHNDQLELLYACLDDMIDRLEL